MPLSVISLCFDPLRLRGDIRASMTALRPEGGLVLQRSAAREKCVLQVIVKHAADRGHVDVSKA